MSVTTSAARDVLRNVYRGPFEVALQRHAPDICFLFGEIRITDLEIGDLQRDEGAFVSLLTARLESAVENMVEYLRAPTFPVHDHPMSV